jgi:trimethylamine--corrinoid protein Co-methyltransferase
MVDVVADVGPGGHFLRSRETRKHLRTGELYVPRHLLREPYETWSTARESEVQRAVAEVEAILVSHRPKPLPDGARDRITAVVAAGGRELGGR